MKLNKEQQKSQISSSHRLIQLTNKLRHKLDTTGGYGEYYDIYDSVFFFNNIVEKLESKLNNSVAKRQSALIKRIKNVKGYATGNLSSVEYAAEALFDSYFFKNNDTYVNRSDTVRLITESVLKYDKIFLVMPILSRKSFSPIKNKGYFPDLGEINTLLRCAKIAKLIENISGFCCEFLVLADGHKYNRACKTPHAVVDLYQQSLEYWVNFLQIGKYVKIKDYEKWVFNEKEKDWEEKRVILYQTTYKSISKRYDEHFNVNNLDEISNTLRKDDLGKQLSYTFWSIITSVNYNSLYPEWTRGSQVYTKDNQNFYVSFIASSHYSLDRIAKSHLFIGDLVGELSYSASDRVMKMRYEAWEAAKKYVAISLVDRKLNTIYKKIPTALKLTIHPKMNEYNFIATNQKNYSMTAQHTVAGINTKVDSITVDYQYRLIREAEKQIAVYIKPPIHKEIDFNPLFEMSLINQPIYYISE